MLSSFQSHRSGIDPSRLPLHFLRARVHREHHQRDPTTTSLPHLYRAGGTTCAQATATGAGLLRLHMRAGLRQAHTTTGTTAAQPPQARATTRRDMTLVMMAMDLRPRRTMDKALRRKAITTDHPCRDPLQHLHRPETAMIGMRCGSCLARLTRTVCLPNKVGDEVATRLTMTDAGSGQLTEAELRSALVNGDWSPFDAHTVRMMIRYASRLLLHGFATDKI